MFICVSKPFFIRKSLSAKNEKDTNINGQSLYIQTTLSMIGEVRENSFGYTCGFAHKYSKSINPKNLICENFCRNLADTNLCMFKFLICENNLSCDETNSAKGYLNHIKLLDPTQGIFHPITHTLYTPLVICISSQLIFHMRKQIFLYLNFSSAKNEKDSRLSLSHTLMISNALMK